MKVMQQIADCLMTIEIKYLAGARDGKMFELKGRCPRF